MNIILQEIFQISLAAKLFSPILPETLPWLMLGCGCNSFWKVESSAPFPSGCPAHFSLLGPLSCSPC